MAIRRIHRRKRRSATKVRTLPLYAAFECTGCGECCRDWNIHVDETAYKNAVEMLATRPHPGRVRGDEAFTVMDDPTEDRYAVLRGREDGSCVFLDEDNLCYWHKHFGYETKGWVCRAYPNSSYRTPGSRTVYGTLSCRPMAEMMRDQFAGPMQFIDAPADMDAAALERPAWTVKKGSELWILDDRRVEAEALDIVQDALLEFVGTDGVPLGIRLRMGRLFLDYLYQLACTGRTLKASWVRQYFERIKGDATDLYLQAKDQSGSIALVGHVVRGMFGRMGNVGVLQSVAARFSGLVDSLQLDTPAELRTLHLQRLHRRFFDPSLPEIEPLLAAYASHRIAKSQSVPNGGIIPGYTDVLLGMALVWSISLADAAAAGEPVDPDMLTTAIHDTERIFMHARDFQSFLNADSGLSEIHSPAFAGVLTEIFCPSAPSTAHTQTDLRAFHPQ